MLQDLLTIIQREEVEVSHADLCRRLGVSPDYLQSMIDILIRKGRLLPGEVPTCGGNKTCTQCSCPGPVDCELVLIKPVRKIRLADQTDG
jgi:hypothetical protein